MPIFSEYYEHFKATVTSEKIKETLERIKKESEHDHRDIKKREDAVNASQKKVATHVSNVTIDSGVVKTYFNDEKYPITGYADVQSVWAVAEYKRLIPLIVRNIAKMGLVKKVVTALGVLFSTKIAAEWFGLIFEMNKILLKDEYYSPCVKEIRRVLRLLEVDERLIDGFGAIMEYDVCYRYPVQDVLPLINKEAFEKNWRKEFKRIFAILLERTSPEDASKFRNIARLIPIYILFNRKLLKGIKTFVKEIDLTKVAPSDNDYYWMCYLETYNCFGMNSEERLAKRIELNGGE